MSFKTRLEFVSNFRVYNKAFFQRLHLLEILKHTWSKFNVHFYTEYEHIFFLPIPSGCFTKPENLVCFLTHSIYVDVAIENVTTNGKTLIKKMKV